MANTFLYPGIYPIADIFDPDSNPTGAIIPKPYSIVIDYNNKILIVESVDPQTKKSKLVVAKASVFQTANRNQNLDLSSIINYGNTRFYAYFNKSVHPTKISIDKKLIILGRNNKYYRLLRLTSDKKYEVVSANYSSTGIYEGDFIPLVEADNNNYIKYCFDCYTNFDIEDGNQLLLEVYDINKNVIYSIVVFAKTTIDLTFTTEPKIITGFELECSQEINNDIFYIYPQQNKNALVLSPKLILMDGTIIPIGIDSEKCYLYGLNDFEPGFPGQETKLICKYFLNQNEVADPNITIDNMLVAEKTLKVVNNISDEYSLKISVIPRYDSVMNKYVLFFFMYVINDLQNSSLKVQDVTPYITLLSKFYGRDDTENNIFVYGTFQEVKFQLRLDQVLPLDQPEYYNQSCLVKLNPFVYYEKYILKDSQYDEYGLFGIESSDRKRPIIHYDVNTQFYKIPETIFPTVDKFLDEFYYRSRPPFDTTKQDNPTKPTHFVIRDIITRNYIISSPISVNEYQKNFTLSNIGLVNTNVIVEFLKQNGNTFIPLYGTPVDITTF